MDTKIQENTTQTAHFDVYITGSEFLNSPFVGPYPLRVEYFTKHPGQATVNTVAARYRLHDVFKWADPLYDHIQKAAESNSISVWQKIDEKAAIKQDQQLLN